MKERLELVTDFSELRTGVVVVCKNCVNCMRDHRLILLSTTNQGPTFADGFSFEPLPKCFPPHPAKYVVSKADVQTGNVYRVVDDHELSTFNRKRKSVRA